MFKNKFLSLTTTLKFLVGTGLGMAAFSANAETVAKVAEGHIIVRKGPASAYKAIATIPTGAKVHIQSCLLNKDWCSIRYNNIFGWAYARYLNVSNVPLIPLKKVPRKYVKKVEMGASTSNLFTGINNRDERTILKPSPTAHRVSVKRVSAYNPLFPESVNDRNAERNETRYRIVTYPAP
ncbi:SH3 domain-containing protein [Bartonella sp. F02]|uniref:SH3 domain-containing protein n=1 Tax=Bartonella sp. F02 TaxID=2967262 RepID=UPI0022A9CBB2|nr:SH3 domain-containing protein [Bartonella sp. F02]MCZ2329004.1 SH3 domain-containing protein [Bartonella sp. F02]